MSKSITTLYTNYRECLLDLDIYGRIVSTPQQSIEEFTEFLYEEFKCRKPFPTLEEKRYELSKLVSPSCKIVYDRELELQDNESLVDLRAFSSRSEIVIEDLTPLTKKVQELFRYENSITDSLRDDIISKYDLDSGELLSVNPVQVEKIHGTTNKAEGLALTDDEILSLGGSHVEQQVDEYEQDSSDLDDEYDYFDIDEGEEIEVNHDDSMLDSVNSESQDDFGSDYDDSYDFSDDDSYEFTEESESSESADEYDFTDDDSYELIDESNPSESVDEYDASSQDSEDGYDDYEDYDVGFDNEYSDDIIVEDQELGEHSNTASSGSDVATKSESDTSGIDFDDIQFEESIRAAVEKAQKDDSGVAKVQTPASETTNVSVSSEPEPTDIRQFIRKHPHCEYSFALQYFTKKQINDAIRIGKIIKKGNYLKI